MKKGIYLFAWQRTDSKYGEIVPYRYGGTYQYYRDASKDFILQASLAEPEKYEPGSGGSDSSVGMWDPVHTLFTIEENPTVDCVLRVSSGSNVNEYKNEHGVNAGELNARYTLSSVSSEYLTVYCQQI